MTLFVYSLVLIFLFSVFLSFIFFFFNDTATTEIYTLSLHDALPITCWPAAGSSTWTPYRPLVCTTDRKSTPLNSSHSQNSYAVFCLKKKKKYQYNFDTQQKKIKINAKFNNLQDH